jgi:hypothetical protein
VQYLYCKELHLGLSENFLLGLNEHFFVYYLYHGVSLRVPDSRLIRTTLRPVRIIEGLLYPHFYWSVMDISIRILSSPIFVAWPKSCWIPQKKCGNYNTFWEKNKCDKDSDIFPYDTLRFGERILTFRRKVLLPRLLRLKYIAFDHPQSFSYLLKLKLLDWTTQDAVDIWFESTTNLFDIHITCYFSVTRSRSSPWYL